MFTALYQNLSQLFPDSRFFLLSPYPKADRKMNRYRNVTVLSGTPLRLLFVVVPLSLIRVLFQVLKIPYDTIGKEPVVSSILEADLVLDICGISFSDGREVYLPYNIVTILSPILLKKKVVKCAQAMGPFNGNVNRWLAKWILPKIDVIFARGAKTKEYLDSIGLSNTVLGADVAFQLNSEMVDLKRIKKFLPSQDGNIVGIAPSSVVYRQCLKRNIDYITIMKRFCEFLIKEYQFEIVLLPHSVRIGTSQLKNNDLPIIYEIADAVSRKESLHVIVDDLTAGELRFIIQRCRFFIASRFHSMVSALSVGVPLIVCGWGHKYFEVLEQFNMVEFALDFKYLSFERLVAAFDNLFEQETSVRCRINQQLPNAVQRAYKHFEAIKRMVA